MGNPEGLSAEQICSQYRLAQYVPCWRDSPDAQEFMQQLRDDPQEQLGIKPIEGALESVRKLQEVVPVVAYLTVRPQSVAEVTKEWLQKHGFPDLPVVAK